MQFLGMVFIHFCRSCFLSSLCSFCASFPSLVFFPLFALPSHRKALPFVSLSGAALQNRTVLAAQVLKVLSSAVSLGDPWGRSFGFAAAFLGSVCPLGFSFPFGGSVVFWGLVGGSFKGPGMPFWVMLPCSTLG